MFNPFHPFTQPVLEALAKTGRHYFVRQTFQRGKDLLDRQTKGVFLITHYSDKTTAEAHYNSIEGDRSRKLYDWNNPEDKEKLRIAAGAPAGYKIYSCLLERNWERKITERIKKQIRIYVDHLGWQPGRGETVFPTFYLQFGELYVHLKYKGREAKLTFEVIENQN